MGTSNRKGQRFYTVTLLVSKQPIKSILDASSPVTLRPKTTFNKTTAVKPVRIDYRGVDDKRRNIEGKTTAIIETNGATDNNLENIAIPQTRLDRKAGHRSRPEHHRPKI